ncbi:MAG TPA: M43 family zinc metalloprotease [Flavipsychrobacter sp.]|nr:M43 family zinc metalloprotease [Flavipsychrobacter sp.]
MTKSWVAWANEHTSRLSKLSRTVASGTAPRIIYQIPVVVHIIHTGGAIGTKYNPTNANIDSLISYTNRAYATTWSSFPDSTHGGTIMPFQFVLAQRDTDCNATNGITRNDGSSVSGYTTGGMNLTKTTGASELSIKNLNRWPVDEYMNIWVVAMIDSTDGYSATSSYVAGFAYVPPFNPPSLDGVVMLAQQVAPISSVTLPHELGHTMSLYHTFQGGDVTTCPTNTNCLTDGDLVCDTQPEKESNFTCPIDPNPCTGTSYDNVQHNFMDYSSCQDRFTPGQRDRTLFCIQNYRQHFIGSLGGVAPTLSPATACTPGITNPSNTFNAGPTEVKISDAVDSTFGYDNVYLDYTSGGYNTDGKNAYLDLSCKQGATLISGNSYLFSVTTGAYSSGENVRIFIDYNNDGKFDTSELVYKHAGTGAHQTDTVSITMPTPSSRSGLATCVPVRMRVISDPSTTYDSACANLLYGQAEDYSLTIKGNGLTAGGVSISLPPGSDTTCTGSSLTFTATPTDTSATGLSYKWYVNNASTGITTKTYISSSLNDGDNVFCKIYYAGTCGSDSAISNTITVHRATSMRPRVSVSLLSGNNPGCPGETLEFSASPVTGGTAPDYQWQVNGTNVGFDAPVYSYIPANGDIVTCILTSNASCASPKTVTSDSVNIIRQKTTESVAITTNDSITCAGRPVTFTSALSYIYITPSYQWYVNGTAIAGATGSTFTSTTLNNGDNIYCVVTTFDSCITNHVDTSNTLIQGILPSVTPTASIAITAGSNPGCIDSFMQFTGTATNVGSSPNYTFLVNGVPAASGTVFSSSTLNNGDVVVFRANVTDHSCYTSDTVYSTSITISLHSQATPPIISLIGDMLVANVPGPLDWYGPDGLIAGANGQSYHPVTEGPYYAEVADSGCNSGPSNVLDIALLLVNSYNLDNVKIYPNPTRGQLTIDLGNQVTNVKVDIYNAVGQGVLHEMINNQSKKVLDLSYLPNGNYFVVLKNEDGKVGTVSISLTK